MKLYKAFFIAATMVGSLTSSAQTEPEDIAAVTDAFQDHYYESLTQKGIENYDRAVNALLKCVALQPSNPAVYNELGRNYLSQKDYKKAYESFEKAASLDPKNMWYYVGMYDVCYESMDFNQAIVIVNKLIPFNRDYKEDLASLYMTTKQFDKALELINELNESTGRTERRDAYKNEILKDAKYLGSEKDLLLAEIKKDPKTESNYINLIYLYSESNQEQKALEIAKLLEREIPESEWAQVSLFKFHLNSNDAKSATAAMFKVLEGKKVDAKIKHRMLNEFLIFSKGKSQYDADIDKAIDLLSNDREVDVAKEIGKFYHSKSDFQKAIRFYEKFLADNPSDYEANILILQALADSKDFGQLESKSDDMLAIYPAQPQSYYFSGLAKNQLKKYKAATDVLESGLDFLIDDIQLEVNFYIQLGEAANGLGDAKTKEKWFVKADTLLKKLNK
ncbi:MAG: tetratricopeptide repeat protein [Flavobacterium sp.]|nr:tetratricopeptide repeat protein [Flavobacterium sp.]